MAFESFDPSPLGTIGERGTRPALEAPARALTLADLVNKEQISRIQLKDEQDEQNTYGALKKYIEANKLDMSKPEDQNKFAAEASRLDPKLGMKVTREMSQQQADQAKLTQTLIDLTKERLTVLSDAATPFVDMVRKLATGDPANGVAPLSDQEIDAKVLPQMTKVLKQLKDAKLSNGEPILTPELQEEAGQLLSGNVRKNLETFAMQHTESMNKLNEIDEKRRKAATEEGQNTETKTVMKGGKPHQVLYQKNTGKEIKDLGEAPPSAAIVNMQASREASGPAATGVVAAAATGMPLNQLIPGYGKNASAERKSARDGAIAMIKRETGLTDEQSGQEYARRTIEFSAGKTSVTALNKMEGFTRSALAQLDFNVKKASEFMDKVPAQTDLSPILNSIVNKEQTWTGNPNMAPLFMYMNAVSIETARLQSGGQASTAQLHQGAAEEAKKWLDAGAITPASWKKLAPEIIAEGENRLKNFQDAKAAMMPSDTGTTPSAPKPEVAPPSGGPKAGGAGARRTATGPDGKKLQLNADGTAWEPAGG